METITETLSNGNTFTYQIVNGTAYKIDTPKAVIDILERSRTQNIRIRLFYGDKETGRCWNDEWGMTGYIGKSTGNIKIPLLIPNSRSMGGTGILDNCIIKIRESKGKTVLYQAANFIQSKFEIIPSDLNDYTHAVKIDGTLNARFKSLKQAEAYINKMI